VFQPADQFVIPKIRLCLEEARHRLANVRMLQVIEKSRLKRRAMTSATIRQDFVSNQPQLLLRQASRRDVRVPDVGI
jgi:hypothetical protein